MEQFKITIFRGTYTVWKWQPSTRVLICGLTPSVDPPSKACWKHVEGWKGLDDAGLTKWLTYYVGAVDAFVLKAELDYTPPMEDVADADDLPLAVPEWVPLQESGLRLDPPRLRTGRDLFYGQPLLGTAKPKLRWFGCTKNSALGDLDMIEAIAVGIFTFMAVTLAEAGEDKSLLKAAFGKPIVMGIVAALVMAAIKGVH